jgi:mono/diheme cytochrome c family protein
MWQTNLKIFLVVLGTLGTFTLVANSIPQVASEVPEELSFTGEFDAGQLVAAGQELFEGAGGCTACHGLGERAPNLLTDHAGQGTIGQRCGTRVSGMDCKAYIHQSLVEPTAFVVEGFQPIMPDASRTLSETQVWALVAYMESQGGEVTVTAADVESPGGGAEGAPAGGSAAPGATTGAAAGAAPGAPGGMDPVALIENNLCLNCHQMDGRGTPLGPSFDGMGGRIDADRIRRGILNPAADVAQGFEALAGIMPPMFGQTFSAAQLEALVEFLAARR